ncbi:dithiol-disulfide isomerase involved in polyketide biosynthesis [Halogeometricum borinquense DSM 11551]|uniref:Dithiol-disulfide isomerase involved in polyketide biosynthesis n=1 Tax=Halogeometricum borinquense (strain ATCC 700274 / DSM 11551 / JCM 10706 / KCTC 4070 / PR3) TaxID=469382 RepID=E4NPV1_HALBP|nr:DsbA family oxidoreductase [Halogeometricum borinquense]ADQ66584.1 predicted dithiol-disulfide isomerase involved in polyketide biosynthesis [Halogeometricum borinquense DSM 11551]ELY30692.1 dithiol-disulfide isomerase involved in polyketide biosynthesis [Halogeometricum borinquense DSM 11551]
MSDSESAEYAEQITVYSDYVCPFCYLGRESLRRYQSTREDELEIDWHPFDLRSQKRNPDGTIDHSVDDGKDDEYYEQAKENVRRLQEKYGVEMDLDVDTDIDSLPAQMASYYVKQHYDYETWLDFDVAIFDALWQDGADIGDEELLVKLAEDAGVVGDEIRSALDDDALREEVRAQFTEAHQQGVTGVPTFAYDGYGARGAVPPEHLERLVEGV